MYLRYELMRDNLDESGLAREFELVRSTLTSLDQPHLNEFLEAWAD